MKLKFAPVDPIQIFFCVVSFFAEVKIFHIRSQVF